MKRQIPWFQYKGSRAGRQLEEFRGNDYASMSDELRAVFKQNDKMRLRYLPIVGRASRDLAPHYIIDPRRSFPASLQGVEHEEVEAILKRWRRVFLATEQAGVAQQAYAYLVTPDEAGRELVLTPVLGYQICEVAWSSAFEVDDLRRAERVTFAVPMDDPRRPLWMASDRRPVSAAFVELTRDEAIITYPGGRQAGVLAPDGSNPLGYVPMVGRRRELPADRVVWVPEPAYDLQSVTIGAVLGISDVENILRVLTPGLLTSKNARNLKAKMGIQPGQMVPLPNDDASVDWLNPQPATDKYLAAVEFTLRLLENYRYMRPGGLSGLTGTAKSMDGQSLTEERSRQDGDLVCLEQELLDLAIDVRNRLLPKALKLPAEIGREMVTTFNLPRPRENVLQERQGLAIACSMGLDSAVERIMLDEGVTQDRAEQLYADRLRRWRDAMGADGATPGMDRLAAQVSKPMTQAASAPSDATDEEPADAGSPAGDAEATA